MVLSGVRKLCRASCCVIVLPPCAARPIPHVRPRRRDDADGVEPRVIVEPLVFDGENRVDEVRRDAGERRLDALFLENREGQLIVAVVDRRRLVHFANPRDGGLGRKVRAKAPQVPERTANRQQRHSHEGGYHQCGDSRGAAPCLTQGFPESGSTVRATCACGRCRSCTQRDQQYVRHAERDVAIELISSHLSDSGHSAAFPRRRWRAANDQQSVPIVTQLARPLLPGEAEAVVFRARSRSA